MNEMTRHPSGIFLVRGDEKKGVYSTVVVDT